jgi:hypothetical protein
MKRYWFFFKKNKLQIVIYSIACRRRIARNPIPQEVKNNPEKHTVYAHSKEQAKALVLMGVI